MNDVRYKWILYTIVIVILTTIGIQVYWNYKNYLNSKQQLINEVQISLDKAVDDYYANLAEKTTIGFAFEGDLYNDTLDENNEFLNIMTQIDESKKEFKNLDSINFKHQKGVSIFRGKKADSLLISIKENGINKDSIKQKFIGLQNNQDSVSIKNIELLTSKIVISISNDTLVFRDVDTLLKNELKRKNLNINYWILFKRNNKQDRTFNKFNVLKTQHDSLNNQSLLKTSSQSKFLPKGSSLDIYFTNETQIILKRILGGILISFLLILAVISSLFYLLHIIKHQKQLAEVKNDLISNITHEFKTPIATISVALESIKDFKIIEDKEKTKKYLDLSSGQLTKLNVMVEKLLETATLDSDSLTLQKESVDVVEILKTQVEKHQMFPIAIGNEHKTIAFSNPSDVLMASVDVFHFENAINNILDNAIKYGGSEIKVAIKQNPNYFTVSISDNGNTITKAHKDKIFEKFYRIPKGNTHDVKGFGIGLYYTKKIVEKHGGSIHLKLDKNLTTFKLSFPNA